MHALLEHSAPENSVFFVHVCLGFTLWKPALQGGQSVVVVLLGPSPQAANMSGARPGCCNSFISFEAANPGNTVSISLLAACTIVAIDIKQISVVILSFIGDPLRYLFYTLITVVSIY